MPVSRTAKWNSCVESERCIEVTDTAISLALRPEAISLGERAGADSRLEGSIADVHFLGSVIRVNVAVGGNVVSLDTFNSPSAPPPEIGQPTQISFAASDVLVLR